MTGNVTPMREGQYLTGETGEEYLVVSPLGEPKAGFTSNVWAAVDAGTQSNVAIIKGPGIEDDYFRTSYPQFRSEMVMHELFKDCPYIRRQIDRIPPRRMSSDPPRVVLEPTESTLWDARLQRVLTDDEIRIIMRGVLLGLRAIHAQGLVYADLKMQNIFVNGFRQTPEQTTTEHSLIAMIGDLGIVMEPASGKVQPLAYRAPEVHFQSNITPAADIWGWGIIFCHLLQAQQAHDKAGLYEFTNVSTLDEAEKAIQRAMADDFDLANNDSYNSNSQSRFTVPRGYEKTGKSLAERLLEAGISQEYIDLLLWVLNPDPLERPSAQDILNHPMIGGEGSDNPTGALPANYPSTPTKTKRPSHQQPSFQQPEYQRDVQQYSSNRSTSPGKGSPSMSSIPESGDFFTRPMKLDRNASSYMAPDSNGASTPSTTEAVRKSDRPSVMSSTTSFWRSQGEAPPPPHPAPAAESEEQTAQPLKSSNNESRGMKRGVSETAVHGARGGEAPQQTIKYQSEEKERPQRPGMTKTWSEQGKATGGLFNPGLMSILGFGSGGGDKGSSS